MNTLLRIAVGRGAQAQHLNGWQSLTAVSHSFVELGRREVYLGFVQSHAAACKRNMQLQKQQKKKDRKNERKQIKQEKKDGGRSEGEAEISIKPQQAACSWWICEL